MNIKTLKEVFEIINIDMLYDEGIIREKKAGNEEYYGFQFSEKLWNIFSYQRGNKKIHNDTHPFPLTALPYHHILRLSLQFLCNQSYSYSLLSVINTIIYTTLSYL